MSLDAHPVLHDGAVPLRLATEADVPALAAIRSTKEVYRWWRGGDDLAANIRSRDGSGRARSPEGTLRQEDLARLAEVSTRRMVDVELGNQPMAGFSTHERVEDELDLDEQRRSLFMLLTTARPPSVPRRTSHALTGNGRRAERSLR